MFSVKTSQRKGCLMPENSKLMELFINILKKMKREWIKALECSLTPSQFFILKTLQHHGPHKATDLAEVVQMTPGAITGAADKLVSEGYIERKGAQEDRRIVYLEITSQGEMFLESVLEKQKAATANFFQGLSQEDINHLVRIFQQISINLDRRN